LKLLDTSVVVDHLRGYGPATALLEELVRSHESVVASELTRFELLAGARPDEHDHLENFFSSVVPGALTESGREGRAPSSSFANMINHVKARGWPLTA
jgi:hypothetical protein